MTATRVYLCGSVRKGRSDARPVDEFWSEENEAVLKNQIRDDIILLNPSKTQIQRSDYFVNFGCDLFLIKNSDIVLADLRTEKGVGVGAELMYARNIGIPVISWIPTNTHYRRDLFDVFGEDLRDWIHPFAYSLSDYIEGSLVDVCSRARRIIDGLDPGIVRDKNINRALTAFEEKYPQIARDLTR